MILVAAPANDSLLPSFPACFVSFVFVFFADAAVPNRHPSVSSPRPFPPPSTSQSTPPPSSPPLVNVNNNNNDNEYFKRFISACIDACVLHACLSAPACVRVCVSVCARARVCMCARARAMKQVNVYFVKFYVVACCDYSCLCTPLGLLKYFDR